jgi:hypothetical protein
MTWVNGMVKRKNYSPIFNPWRTSDSAAST